MDGTLLRPGFERLGDAWRWWLGELGALVPDRLRAAFAADDAVLIEAREAELVVARRAGHREYTVARIPRDDFVARTLRLSVPQPSVLPADPVILQLPAAEALERSLTLPDGARRNLDAILRHEIVRHSPLDAQTIYYDYRIQTLDRAAGTLTVALRIVRREAVDALVQLASDAGITLAAIEFAGDEAHADGGTFPVDTAAARRMRLRPRLVPALATLLLVLALGLVAAVYLRGVSIAGDLADRVDTARTRAMVVERLQGQFDAANRQAAFLAQQKRNPASVAVLATVARLLPDDAWLYEFEFSGDEVRLHGFSASAASLIAKFDSSAYFRDAEMRSPLMQGPTNGTQRFDISFKLRKPAT